MRQIIIFIIAAIVAQPSAVTAAELTYETVAMTPCSKLVQIVGTELFGPTSETIVVHVVQKLPRQSAGMSGCNVSDMIVKICRQHPRFRVSEAVSYFARGTDLPTIGRCGA